MTLRDGPDKPLIYKKNGSWVLRYRQQSAGPPLIRFMTFRSWEHAVDQLTVCYALRLVHRPEWGPQPGKTG